MYNVSHAEQWNGVTYADITGVTLVYMWLHAKQNICICWCWSLKVGGGYV